MLQFTYCALGKKPGLFKENLISWSQGDSERSPGKFWTFQTVIKFFPHGFKGSNCLLWKQKEHLSPIMLTELFSDSLTITKCTRISTVCDWVARVVFPIQILLIFSSHCNRFFWDIPLKIYRLPYFNTLFQFLLTKFSKSKLFLCLQKVDHMTNNNIAKGLLLDIHVITVQMATSPGYWFYCHIHKIVVLTLYLPCLLLERQFEVKQVGPRQPWVSGQILEHKICHHTVPGTGEKARLCWCNKNKGRWEAQSEWSWRNSHHKNWNRKMQNLKGVNSVLRKKIYQGFQ